MAALAIPAWIAGAGAGAGAGAAISGAGDNKWYEDFMKWIGQNFIEKPTEDLAAYLARMTGYGRLWGNDINKESDVVLNPGIPSPMPGTATGVITGEFESKDAQGFTPMASLGMTADPGINPVPPANDDEEKKEEQIGNPIIDSTEENVENSISAYDNIERYMKLFQEQQDKYIALQEKWRAEDQERADNAYQRAIKDMYKSGIDPNQIGNVTPAEVGGQVQQPFNGITTGLQTALSKEMEVLQTMIENSFKGDENDKDRFTDIFNKVLGVVAILGAASMKG